MAPPKYKNLEHSSKTGSKSVTMCKLNSHVQSHTQTQVFTKNSSSRKLQHLQYFLGRIQCPFFLFWLCNLLTRLSIWEEETENNGTLAEMPESHWGTKRCQLDITADPRGVEEKLEDITVHLRGDTVQ